MRVPAAAAGISFLLLLGVSVCVRAQNCPHFPTFRNIEETSIFTANTSGCADVKITDVPANFKDHIKIFQTLDDEAAFVLQIFNLSTYNDIKKGSYPVAVFFSYDGIPDTLSVNIKEENNRDPEFENADVETWPNISKQYPVGIPLQILYPDYKIVVLDIDYVQNKTDPSNTVESCSTDQDFVACEPKQLDVGQYELNIFFTMSLAEANVGKDLRVNIVAKDGGGRPTLAPKTVILQFLAEDYFPPRFSSNSYRASIGNEKLEGPGKELVKVTAEDGDNNGETEIAYTLVETDPVEAKDYFSVNPDDGAVMWTKDLTTDLRRKGNIFITVQAQESSTDKKRTSETVVVVQVEGDNHPPAFTEDLYPATIQ